MPSSANQPLYTKIIAHVDEQIHNGMLKHGERLPNERWLCETYGISRTTLRKAIDALIIQGLVERRANKGIYVTYAKYKGAEERPFSIFQELQRSGVTPSTKILAFNRIKASAELSNHLQCLPKEPLMEIHRLRMADGIPFAIQILYMSEHLFPQLNPWLLTDRSLYDVMLAEYDIVVVESRQVITTTLSTKQQSEHLNTPVHTPLLVSTSKSISQNNDIVCFQHSFILTSVIPYSYKFKWA